MFNRRLASIITAMILLLAGCSPVNGSNTNENENGVDVSSTDEVSGGRFCKGFYPEYWHDIGVSVAVVRVLEKAQETRVLYDCTESVELRCELLYLYNQSYLEETASFYDIKLVLTGNSLELPECFIVYVQKAEKDNIQVGDIALLNLRTAVSYENDTITAYAAVWPFPLYYDDILSETGIAIFENGILKKDDLYSGIMMLTRLYRDEEKATVGYYETIKDSETVEDVVNFLKRVEDDVRRFEEDRSNIIYNEIF